MARRNRLRFRSPPHLPEIADLKASSCTGRDCRQGRFRMDRDAFHVVELLANRERLAIRHQIPFVTRDAPVERPKARESRFFRCLSDPKRSRRVVRSCSCQPINSAADAFVSGEQQPCGSGRNDLGLAAGDVSERAIGRISERRLKIVSKTEVQRESRMQPDIILDEQAVIPGVVDLCIGAS